MLSKLELYTTIDLLFIEIEDNSIGIGEIINNKYFYYWQELVIGLFWYNISRDIFKNIKRGL